MVIFSQPSAKIKPQFSLKMPTTEFELTFLPKTLPIDLKTLPQKEVHDIYFPVLAVHPQIRLRKNGDKFELTKKHHIKAGDPSAQFEFTIPLTQTEFADFKTHPGKSVRKIRHNWDSPFGPCEIDVFQDDLKGLILLDFEFDSEEKKNNFQAPDFILADVTQETFLAGGMLAGKSFSDIESDLNQFNFKPLK